MIKTIVFAILSGTLLVSCSTSKKSTSPSSNGYALSQSEKTFEDALSYATAIVINEKNEGDGVNAEYMWIKQHYSDYKFLEQSLLTHKKKPYDVNTIVLSDGKEVKLYFDISNFFGKF